MSHGMPLSGSLCNGQSELLTIPLHRQFSSLLSLLSLLPLSCASVCLQCVTLFLHLLQVKKIENERALGNFLERIQILDSLPWEEKQMNLIEGILAGNVFDWGAKVVTE